MGSIPPSPLQARSPHPLRRGCHGGWEGTLNKEGHPKACLTIWAQALPCTTLSTHPPISTLCPTMASAPQHWEFPLEVPERIIDEKYYSSDVIKWLQWKLGDHLTEAGQATLEGIVHHSLASGELEGCPKCSEPLPGPPPKPPRQPPPQHRWGRRLRS